MKTLVLKEQKLFDKKVKEWGKMISILRYKYLKNYVIKILGLSY